MLIKIFEKKCAQTHHCQFVNSRSLRLQASYTLTIRQNVSVSMGQVQACPGNPKTSKLSCRAWESHQACGIWGGGVSGMWTLGFHNQTGGDNLPQCSAITSRYEDQRAKLFMIIPLEGFRSHSALYICALQAQWHHRLYILTPWASRNDSLNNCLPVWPRGSTRFTCH